jgi:hypothetical protein
MLGVKNNGKETLKARFDGKDYEFKPGVTLAVSDDAAAHIFGYGEDNKDRALHRLGWLGFTNDRTGAMAKLAEFVFLGVEEVKFKDEQPTPLHPEKSNIEIPKLGDKAAPMAKAPELQRQFAGK